MPYKNLWITLGAVLIISFAVLGGVGINIQSSAPPIPQRVVTSDGRPLFDGDTIQRGQEVWQSLGGQQIGSTWGHGAYIAPDWAAVEYGTWYARSAEFLQTGLMDTLRWLRVIGDTIFAVGVLALGWFVLGLLTGHSLDAHGSVAPGESEIRPRLKTPQHQLGD